MTSLLFLFLFILPLTLYLGLFRSVDARSWITIRYQFEKADLFLLCDIHLDKWNDCLRIDSNWVVLMRLWIVHQGVLVLLVLSIRGQFDGGDIQSVPLFFA